MKEIEDAMYSEKVMRIYDGDEVLQSVDESVKNVSRGNVGIAHFLQENFDELVDINPSHGKEKEKRVVNALRDVLFDANRFLRECEEHGRL